MQQPDDCPTGERPGLRNPARSTPRRWRAAPWVGLLLLGAGLLPAALYAQQPGSQPGIFGEIIDVRVVNLEVVVTDRDGVPVRGLQPGDFRLLVDGEEVPIDYFSEIRAGQAVQPTTEGIEGVPAIVPGSPVPTSYLVFIDDYFTIGRDRDRVLTSLMDDLPLLGPEDRMAIVAYDGLDLEMLTTWTSSVPALERVLKRAMERRARGLERLAEQRQFDFDRALDASFQIREGTIETDDFFRTGLSPSERAYVSRLAGQVERTIAAATATLRSFAAPPGRKVMLLLSGGWPFFPAEFAGLNASRFVLERDGAQGPALFRSVTDTANLLGYTLYPVDVPGFSDTVGGDASVAVPAGLDPVTRRATGQFERSSFLRQQEQHYTLTFLARETGGEAFIDSRRTRAFERTVSDTRSYYWLGFSPAREWDDLRHQVEVEVRNPDLRVRSRSGFLDSSRQSEVTMAVESSLLFGNPSGEQALKVAVGEPRKVGRGKMEVPLEVQVPLDQVTFLPTAQGQATQLELRVAVQDESGRTADIPVIPVVIQVADPPDAGAVGKYATTLKLRRQEHRAVVAIYDPASGRILASTTQIRP